MSAQVRVLLESILESTELIERYVNGLAWDTFFTSQQTQDAVLRRIEIIGEAVKSLPQDWKDANPVAPWREMARMRDIVIHRYFSVDLPLVWQTIQVDIPELKRIVTELLKNLP
ncbi:MAG TPA: DUF86 domain-containing protein [Ktedonobacterales bacterium]|nr:DUF86 domain-containing protein [Ktedonobacterales bacterium]